MGNVFASLSTNSDGVMNVNLEEGTCYMQEAMNPEGYAYDDRVYRIDVTDSNRSLDISENEITNTSLVANGYTLVKSTGTGAFIIQANEGKSFEKCG